MLNSASTKLREVKTFEDDNEVKELTTKFNDNAAKMKQLYSQYKVNGSLHYSIFCSSTLTLIGSWTTSGPMTSISSSIMPSKSILNITRAQRPGWKASPP